MLRDKDHAVPPNNAGISWANAGWSTETEVGARGVIRITPKTIICRLMLELYGNCEAISFLGIGTLGLLVAFRAQELEIRMFPV